MQHISTKLHKVVEELGSEAGFLEGVPLFVIDPDVMSMMLRADVQGAIANMIDADMAHLPLNPMIIEYEVVAQARRFVLLSEKAGGFVATSVTMFPHLITIAEKPSVVTLEHEQIAVSGAAGSDGEASAMAVALALLLINTRGIRKDVVVPEALNRSRAARGKPVVPHHTIMRIGTVYERDGKTVAGGGAGKTMVPHYRIGHARNQACGPEMSERVYRWIDAVVVNGAHGEPRRPIKVVAR